jgi:predicted house-cleaning noncanonical NTP pyrophosphatase (MazG superfamily)
MCAPAKKQFLHDELFSLTLMAAVQRGKTYRENTLERERKQFHQELQRRLEEIAAEYLTDKTDEEHEKSICWLADTLSSSHSAVLRAGRFRIGNAQKALNLFLKYLWCLEEIPPPPHCPFDFGIINKFKRTLPPGVPTKWTELDRIEHYREYVNAARTLAHPHSLAKWELEIYNGINGR